MKPLDLPVDAQSVPSVRPYRDGDRTVWSAFVEACAEATFFHRIEWRDLMEEVFRHRTHYLVAERGGALVGVLPLARVKSWLFGDALVSLPFAVYGGLRSATRPRAVRCTERQSTLRATSVCSTWSCATGTRPNLIGRGRTCTSHFASNCSRRSKQISSRSRASSAR